jgi:hypothetical protein
MTKKKKKKPTLETQTSKVDAIAERFRKSGAPSGFSYSHVEHTESLSAASSSVRERYHWKEVHAPKTWYPKMPGAELVGFYGGRTTRTGYHGQYDVILVHVPAGGSYMVSGSKLMQLVDAAMLDIGHPIRVVWEGHQNVGTTASGEEKRMKLFRVLVAEGDPIDAADLPRVSQ